MEMDTFPSHTAVPFCYPVCTWDRGRYWAAPSLRGALMRTLESWHPAHLLSSLPCLDSGSSGWEGLCPLWEL